VEQKARRLAIAERLNHSLRRPLRCWMLGHTDVDNRAPLERQNYKAVEYADRRLRMVKKSQDAAAAKTSTFLDRTRSGEALGGRASSCARPRHRAEQDRRIHLQRVAADDPHDDRSNSSSLA
jgi:hypothetical protein